MLQFSYKILYAVGKNVSMDDIIALKSKESLARLGKVPNHEFEKVFKKIEQDFEKEVDTLIKEKEA